jgi:AmpE protein
LPSFLFALAILFYAWGPRDLDHDVEAVVEAADPEARRAAAGRLFPDRDAPPTLDGGSLVEAVFRCALWRWFGVLFWFLLLGAFGALLYRLVSLCAQGEARKRMPEGASQARAHAARSSIGRSRN